MARREETPTSACTPEQLAARGTRLPVNLALQGGGSHGAFTWGVLDRLLEDDSLALDAISATSAGAMNAVVMAHGVSLGGREGARRKLEEFWRAISRRGTFFGFAPPNPFGPFLQMTPWEALAHPTHAWMQAFTALFSPYDLNPFDLNPLRDTLTTVVDFKHLNACPHATRLFLSATNVRTGKIRVFENHEITPETVLASACLPYIFKAVEIGDAAYWDGGFVGNPALFPLYDRGASRDIIVVHVNPIVRPDVPHNASDIADRMNEIAFNASLMGEFRAIAFVQKLMDEKRLDETRYKFMLMHDIRDDDAMGRYGVESKFSTAWSFLTELKDLGRSAAERWLTTFGPMVGKRSTTPIRELYL